jgi:di- and tripeptidase
LVLASAISVYQGRRIYITGGNDNDVAIWDITEVNEEQTDGLRNNNGEIVVA